MSGLVRRVARNLGRKGHSSGYKAGRNLERIFPSEGRESFPKKVRRYLRLSYLRAAGVRTLDGSMIGDGGPLGVLPTLEWIPS